MKELTKKVVEAGLVDQSTLKLMKMWGMVDEEVDGTKIAETKEELTALVDDIAKLLEQDGEVPELRETDLELEEVMKQPVEVKVDLRDGSTYTALVGVDRTGHIIFRRADGATAPEDACANPGVLVHINGRVEEIVSAEPRYEGDKLKYYVCEVQSATLPAVR
jgi:hypothetical protein